MVLGKNRVSPTSSVVGSRSPKEISNINKGAKSTPALVSVTPLRHDDDKGAVESQQVEDNHPGAVILDNNSASQKHSKTGADLTRAQCGEDDKGSMSLAGYFQHVEDLDLVDTDYLDELIANGANLNAADQHGSSPVHYAAMSGSVELAAFLYHKGADFSSFDSNGYHPLHLAACADHSPLVEYLLHVVGVDVDVRTKGDQLTAVHCAVRLNSLDSLSVLVDAGANYELQDYRGRTPLHLAAEYDRSLSAQYLLGLSPPAACDVRDYGGLMALSVMVRNMPKVAEMAMNSTQVWEKDANKGRQKFYLLKLENDLASQHWTPSVFTQIVESKDYDLLTHSSVQELLAIKWKFVRPLFLFHCFLYAIFLLSWTIILAYPSTLEFHVYTFPMDVWRVLLWALALSLYLFQIGEELYEIILGKLSRRHFAKWHKCGLLQDMEYLQDPHMVHLKEYITDQLGTRRGSCIVYLKNLGNLMDIATYLTLTVTFILHLVDIGIHHITDEVAMWQSRVSCLAILLIWLRVLKYARAFSALGPFIIIIGYALRDILRYFFVFAVFIIPFSVCFWIVFGGRVDDPSVSSLPRVVFMLYRVSLVDEYPFDAMSNVDEVMAIILVGLYLWVTAVVGLNLFIALLSYTFQRVYDNASANAQLQRSEIILELDLKLPRCLRQRYQRYMKGNCDPFVCAFDDDDVIGGSSVGKTRNNAAVVKQLREVLRLQKEMMGELQVGLKTLSKEQNRESRAASRCSSHATRLRDDTAAQSHTSLFRHLVSFPAHERQSEDRPSTAHAHESHSCESPSRRVMSTSVLHNNQRGIRRWKGVHHLA